MERLFYRLFSSPHDGGRASGSSPRPHRQPSESRGASPLPTRSKTSQSMDRSDSVDVQTTDVRSRTSPRVVSSEERLSVWCERHLTVGRWEKEVAECSQRLKDSRRKEPEQLAQDYGNRARAWKQLEQWELTVGDCNKALALLGPSAHGTTASFDLYTERGNAFGMLGNWQAAVRDCTLAIAAAPPSPTAPRALGGDNQSHDPRSKITAMRDRLSVMESTEPDKSCIAGAGRGSSDNGQGSADGNGNIKTNGQSAEIGDRAQKYNEDVAPAVPRKGNNKSNRKSEARRAAELRAALDQEEAVLNHWANVDKAEEEASTKTKASAAKSNASKPSTKSTAPRLLTTRGKKTVPTPIITKASSSSILSRPPSKFAPAVPASIVSVERTSAAAAALNTSPSTKGSSVVSAEDLEAQRVAWSCALAVPYLNRAVALRMLEEFELSANDCTKAIELDPSDPAAFENRALANRKLGKWELVASDLDAVSKFNPSDPRALCSQGAALGKLGRTAEALACLDAAVTCDSSYAPARLNRAVALRRLKRWPECVADATAAARLDPTSAAARACRAFALVQMNRFAEAASDYGAALRLDPKDSASRLNRAAALTKLARFQEAVEDLDVLLDAAPTHVAALRARAAAHKALGRHLEAVNDLNALIAMDIERAADGEPGNDHSTGKGIKTFELLSSRVSTLAARVVSLVELKCFDEAAADVKHALSLVQASASSMEQTSDDNNIPVTKSSTESGTRVPSLAPNATQVATPSPPLLANRPITPPRPPSAAAAAAAAFVGRNSPVPMHSSESAKKGNDGSLISSSGSVTEKSDTVQLSKPFAIGASDASTSHDRTTGSPPVAMSAKLDTLSKWVEDRRSADAAAAMEVSNGMARLLIAEENSAASDSGMSHAASSQKNAKKKQRKLRKKHQKLVEGAKTGTLDDVEQDNEDAEEVNADRNGGTEDVSNEVVENGAEIDDIRMPPSLTRHRSSSDIQGFRGEGRGDVWQKSLQPDSIQRFEQTISLSLSENLSNANSKVSTEGRVDRGLSPPKAKHDDDAQVDLPSWPIHSETEPRKDVKSEDQKSTSANLAETAPESPQKDEAGSPCTPESPLSPTRVYERIFRSARIREEESLRADADRFTIGPLGPFPTHLARRFSDSAIAKRRLLAAAAAAERDIATQQSGNQPGQGSSAVSVQVAFGSALKEAGASHPLMLPRTPPSPPKEHRALSIAADMSELSLLDTSATRANGSARSANLEAASSSLRVPLRISSRTTSDSPNMHKKSAIEANSAAEECTKSSDRRLGKLRWDEKCVLGVGSFGTTVYAGHHDEWGPVAVKAMARQTPLEESIDSQKGSDKLSSATPAGLVMASKSQLEEREFLDDDSESRVVHPNVVLESTFLAERATLVALAQHAYHPNVVKYFGVEEETTADVGTSLKNGSHFVYLALEQCAYSLHDLFHPPSRLAAAINSHHASTPPRTSASDDSRTASLTEADQRLASALAVGREALSNSRLRRVTVCESLASALNFLHSVGVVHGDLRPRNVLFTWDGTLKLSDFGLSRQLSTNPSQNVRKLSPGLPSGLDGGDTASNGAADDDDDASFSWEAHSGPTGGGGWFAPEVYRKQRKTRAVDLFGLGCVAFFANAGGRHPFHGDPFAVVAGQHDLSTLQDQDPEAASLVLSLIAHDPSKRLNASQALGHPYFWPSSQRLSYLDDVANKLDRLRPKLDQLAVSAAAAAARVEDSSGQDAKSRSIRKGSCSSGISVNNSTADSTNARSKSTSNGADSEARMKKERAGYWQWGDVVHPQLLTSVGRHRSYDTCSLPDLLRFLRNFNQHFADQTSDAIAVLKCKTLKSASASEIQHQTVSMLKKTEVVEEKRTQMDPSKEEKRHHDSVNLGTRNHQKLSPTAMDLRPAANDGSGELEMAEWRASVLSSTAKQRAVIEAYVSHLFPSLVVDLWSALGTEF